MNQYPPQERELAATKGSVVDHPDMLSDFGFMVAVVAVGVALVGVGWIARGVWEQWL